MARTEALSTFRIVGNVSWQAHPVHTYPTEIMVTSHDGNVGITGTPDDLLTMAHSIIDTVIDTMDSREKEKV